MLQSLNSGLDKQKAARSLGWQVPGKARDWAAATLRGKAFSFPLAEPCPGGCQTIPGHGTNEPLVAEAPKEGRAGLPLEAGAEALPCSPRPGAGAGAVEPRAAGGPPPSRSHLLPASHAPTPVSCDSATGEGSARPQEPGGLSPAPTFVILRPACLPQVVSLHT